MKLDDHSFQKIKLNLVERFNKIGEKKIHNRSFSSKTGFQIAKAISEESDEGITYINSLFSLTILLLEKDKFNTDENTRTS